MPNRRKFLLAATAIAGGGYIHHRGLRYPRMGFEPRALSNSFSRANTSFLLNNLIYAPRDDELRFRAISPEPRLQIASAQRTRATIEMGNIAPSAVLRVSGGAASKVHESVTGISRGLDLDVPAGQELSLSWFLPQQEGCRFAVIGDTGAGDELEWSLQYTSKAGADFLLHLGDFNYVEGEYERAIELFDTAPLPCYVSIGNHDFNDSGLVYDQFLDRIGPLNHSFTLAGTQFINVDTAADFFPAYSGLRGKMLDRIESAQQRVFDSVCFTHRTFVDPRPGRHHDIGGLGEKAWLADKLSDCGVENILTGHVHRSAEMEYRKLKQYTVGEGLAFEDIVHERLVAKFLMGTVEMGRPVNYQWRNLDMPWALHTSPEHEEKLIREHPPEKLAWYRKKLAEAKAAQS